MKKIISSLMSNPLELRDEIFCQIMKQSRGNPDSESTFRGWQLLNIMLATFPPSSALKVCM